MTHRRILQLDGYVDDPDPEIDPRPHAMGDVVREIYMTCYRQATGNHDYGREKIPDWDGGETSLGKRCKNKWPDIASHLLRLDADPFEFIQVQFLYAQNLHRPPTPNMLLGDKALALWRSHQTDAVRLAENQLSSQGNLLQLAVRPMVVGLGYDELRAVRYCLNSTSVVNLSPLFRYCAAIHYGLPEIAARFYDQALIEYAFQKRIYDAVWKQLIPPSLQGAATELRTRLGGF